MTFLKRIWRWIRRNDVPTGRGQTSAGKSIKVVIEIDTNKMREQFKSVQVARQRLADKYEAMRSKPPRAPKFLKRKNEHDEDDAYQS